MAEQKRLIFLQTKKCIHALLLLLVMKDPDAALPQESGIKRGDVKQGSVKKEPQKKEIKELCF